MVPWDLKWSWLMDYLGGELGWMLDVDVVKVKRRFVELIMAGAFNVFRGEGGFATIDNNFTSCTVKIGVELHTMISSWTQLKIRY